MAELQNKITMEMKYSNTDFTRNFIIENVPTATLAQAEAKVIAINASIAGGTDGGLKQFFRSNDFDNSDPNNIIGEFTGIKHLRTESVEEIKIF